MFFCWSGGAGGMPNTLNARDASVLLLLPFLGLPNGLAQLPVCIDVLKDGSED